MVQIDPQGWLIKELDFEKSDEENLFQLEHAACVLGRLEAGRALVKAAKDKPRSRQGRWQRPGSGKSRRWPARDVSSSFATATRPSGRLARGGQDPEARVRVAAIAGLARLKRDEQSESSPPRGLDQSQGSLRCTQGRACAGWSPGRSRTPTSCWRRRSRSPPIITRSPRRHSSSSWKHPEPKRASWPRSTASMVSPNRLRSTAIGAFSRLAKDDPSLQDVLVELADDPDRSVRLQAWNAVRELKVKKALPVLEARLARESADFGGYTRHVLEEAIETLKDNAGEPKEKPPADSRTGQRPSPSSNARPPTSRRRPKS